MKILIAEDDDVARAKLESMLAKRGFDVVAASDGAQAWDILQQDDAPALAILDWMMPGLDGMAVCRKVREARRASYIYIIMLTAKENTEDLVAAMEAGADDYLSKPFDIEELRARVRAGERILELQEALRVQATHDALTGLLNRGAIFDILKRHVAQAVRTGTPVAVILMDLDHFKEVNDTHGHPAGDAVLREAAKRLQDKMRPYDAIGRYGGEEFLIVLPGCDISSATIVAERARSAIAAAPVEIEGAVIAVTGSFGVASRPAAEMLDTAAVVNAADEALYRAKHAGRNRVAS